MIDFYNSNSDFKEYVDKYAKNYSEGHSISVEEALTHKIVKNIAEEYRKDEVEKNEIKRD